MGRKGKYLDWITKDKLRLIEGWKRNGLTDEQIASNIGINKTTLYDWSKRFPEFSNSLKKGLEEANIAVENALFKSACGYKSNDDRIGAMNLYRMGINLSVPDTVAVE